MYSVLVLTSLAAALVNAQSAAYGQCGGVNWTGATTCVAGYTCTYSNDFYSQCIPGTAAGTTTTTTKATTTTTKATTTTTKTSTTTTAVSTAKPTFYIAGDSTAAVDAGQAYTGWGTQIAKYLTLPVVNNAVAGESSRSFTVEGKFTAMINTVKSGDIVIIEFGHNDGGGATATTKGVCGTTGVTTTCDVNGTIVYTFNKYIEDAVNGFKAKGAKVIVSSQTPNNPYDGGFGAPRFVGYAQTAAANTGVTYLDHFDYVIKEWTALGETVVNGLFPVDHTHTNAVGADYVAQALVRAVICGGSANPLYPYVKTTNVVPSTCL